MNDPMLLEPAHTLPATLPATLPSTPRGDAPALRVRTADASPDAGLLARLAGGQLLRAELRRLSAAQRARLWRDVLEADRDDVDLSALPDVHMESACFLAVRSRGMLARVRASGRASDWTLRRVVVRNRWTDLLDWTQPGLLADAAAAENAVWLLRHLIEDRRAVRPCCRLAEAAAAGGHLEAVVYLHECMPAHRWPARVMDKAAASGNLELVVWLHTHRRDGCSAAAIDAAASNGHLLVVDWLARNRAEGCTASAVRGAAQNGHLDVLALVRIRFPAVFDAAATTHAAHFATALPVVQWFNSLGLVHSPQDTLGHAVCGGNVSCARWIYTHFGLAVSPWHLAVACKHNYHDMAEWLISLPAVCVEPEHILDAVDHCAIDVLNVLIRADPARIDVIARAAVSRNNSELIDDYPVYSNYPGTHIHTLLVLPHAVPLNNTNNANNNARTGTSDVQKYGRISNSNSNSSSGSGSSNSDAVLILEIR
ncbi:hypothetical protein HK105_204605 [Polyrhizophydium stewartii]|uniref:Ankyrin repeat protein n=1 Tax=Polyrhizophydium stewartii TaxID=2732419 RepID=A0ABR4N8R5_9FUNG